MIGYLSSNILLFTLGLWPWEIRHNYLFKYKQTLINSKKYTNIYLDINEHKLIPNKLKTYLIIFLDVNMNSFQFNDKPILVEKFIWPTNTWALIK